MGYFDIALDPVTGRFEVIPLRLLNFHANVAAHMQSSAYLAVSIYAEDYDTGEFHLDVTLTHPFPNSDLRGFDVRGIVISTLSSKDDPDILSSKDDPDILWAGPNGFELMNEDGWTRWWNIYEFGTPGLFGYTEGFAGNKNFYVGTTINPYKYFSHALLETSQVTDYINWSNRGTTASDEGSVTRRYHLRFPAYEEELPDIRFQYAVDASWAPPTGGLPVPGIYDFPLEANCPEAFHIEIEVDPSKNTVFYNEGGESGGDLILDIEIFDWGAKDNPGGMNGEIEQIRISYPDEMPGGDLSGYMPTGSDFIDIPLIPLPGSTECSAIYHVEVRNVVPSGLTDQQLIVTVVSSDPDSYEPPTGVVADYPAGAELAAYAVFDVPVKGINPEPIGGIVTTGNAVDVKTIGNLCYLLDDIDGLEIINVSDPANPFVLNTVSFQPNVPANLDVVGGFAYVSDSAGFLRVVDVVPIGNAGIVHSVNLPSQPAAQTTDGNYMYVGDTADNVHIIDISTPGSAFITNSFALNGAGPIRDLSAMDGYVYVAADDLEIFDVDPPGTAGWVSSLATSPLYAVDASEMGYAFAGDSSDQLLVIDIEPPGSASVVEILSMSDQINDIDCDWNMVYITVSGKGLEVVFFNEATNTATSIGDLDTTKEAEALSVVGNIAYIDGELVIVKLWDQEPELIGWARTWGGYADSHNSGCDTFGVGYVYVIGSYYGTIDLDPGPGVDEHTAMGETGDPDLYLSKFDPSSNFEWARTWGGIDYDQIFDVGADNLGNAFVVGLFQGTVDLDPGPGVDYHTPVGGLDDIFLSKFDSAGNFLWAQTWGGSFDDEGKGVATDNSGNVYVVGIYSGLVDFDPGPGTDIHTATGSTDIFLSKFDSSGAFQWVNVWGGSEIQSGNAVATDNSGNIYVTGYFEGSVDFDPGPGTDIHYGIGDSFMSKFNSSGNFLWVRPWGGSTIADGVGSFDIALDNTGYAFVVGQCVGTVDFDPGAGTNEFTVIGEHDAFLSIFDTSGNYIWTGIWGAPEADSAKHVKSDDLGNVYVTGYYMLTVDFDPGPGVSELSGTGYYVSKFNSSGDFQWVRTVEGEAGAEGYGVSVDDQGNPYVVGSGVGHELDFDPGPGFDFHPEGVFLIKYQSDGYW